MKASSTNLRGQMGLRSGPLAPTSAKLTTQYLVLDHMNNHYSKITKAKPAIDNKPPKSMSTSQKARDRKTREVVEKTGQRPSSSFRTRRPYTSTGYYQDDIYDENLWGEVDPNDEEEMLIHNIMRTTLKGNDPSRGPATHGSNPQYYQGYQENERANLRPSSARSLRSVGSGVARTMVQVKKAGTYDGDLLQKRSHVFTEEKPFTPRTLKTDRKSRLSQYKYYNKLPPKETKAKQQTAESNPVSTEKVTDEETAEKRPQPKPRAAKRLDQTREGPVTMNSLMFETLHSRDFSKYEKQNGNSPDVPKLDISLDTDHLKWIKDQASKAQYRTNSETMKSTLPEEDAYDTTVDYGKTGEMSLTYGTLGSTKTRPPLGASQRKTPEDEEGMYVQFMKEVTNDIINRGIYTDRAVRQVFKAHIAKNKDRLDELRMRQITDDIRSQLNIPRYDLNDDTSYTSTKETHQIHNTGDLGLDLTTSARGHGHREPDSIMNGSLELSSKSRASKASTEQESHDTYNFKSTEDEDLYSTIRSEMNNTGTLTDTMALKSYQASLKQQDIDEVEEGEIVMRHDGNEAGAGHGAHGIHDNSASRQAHHNLAVNRNQRDRVSDRATDDGTEYQDDDDDEYDDEDYEEEGDDEEDEEEDDIVQTTEPTATYRTDDDDF